MRRPILFAALATLAPVLLSAGPALAMDRYGTVSSYGGRGTAVDPDAKLERLAAASAPTPRGGHNRPARSMRNILRNDANLRSAFAWMDNK